VDATRHPKFFGRPAYTFLVALITFGVFSIPTQARAECFSEGCRGQQIVQLYPGSGGNTLVYLDGPTHLANCGRVSGLYFTLTAGTKNYNAMFSTLLAARITNQPVAVFILENSAGCTINAVIL